MKCYFDNTNILIVMIKEDVETFQKLAKVGFVIIFLQLRTQKCSQRREIVFI